MKIRRVRTSKQLLTPFGHASRGCDERQLNDEPPTEDERMRAAAVRVVEAWLKYSYAQPTIQALNDLARELGIPLSPRPVKGTSK